MQPRASLLRVLRSQKSAFLVVGGINTVIGLACFALAHRLWAAEIGYMGSLVVAYGVAILVAFFLHRRFVFRVRAHVLKDLVRFTSVNLGALGINAVLLPLSVEVLKAPVLPAQAVVVLLTVCLSYFAHRAFSFRRAHPADTAPESS